MIRTVLAMTVIAFGVSAVVAQGDPIAQRKALMKGNGQQNRIATDMVENKAPFDLTGTWFVDLSQGFSKFMFGPPYPKFKPDAAEQSGLLSGFGGAAVAIDKSITVNEYFAEIRVPIVQDKKGAQDLSFVVNDQHAGHSGNSTTNVVP